MISKKRNMRIDSHQHYWKFNEERDSWITEDMAVIRRNFLPEDFESVLKNSNMEGSVVVQSDQSKEENIFQLANALKNDFIKGVVGWVDLQADDIDDQLDYYKEFHKLKGFRHVLQGEKQRDFMLRPYFKRGVGKLRDRGFTYDILIYPDQLKYAEAFVKSFPDQPFVLDHLAKPNIRDKHIDEWKKGIESLAAYENVYCKISGMVTEARWNSWEPEDFTPYLDVVVTAFGPARLMFGSDWPVCLVAATDYNQVVGIVSNYFSAFSGNEQDLIFGKNAARFYNL